MEYKINSMVDKNILIVGGLGFLGSNLAIKLIDLGANVTLLSKTNRKIMNINEIKDKVELIINDIGNENKEIIRDKDIIFNFSGQTSHISAMKDPINDINSNCVGTIDLLELCRKYNDTAKIVFAGTVTQVGKVDKKITITEDMTDRPIDIYSADKLAAEKYHVVYNNVYGIATSSIRLSTVYGERQQVTNMHRGITNLFIKKAMCGESISIYGDGLSIRDYVYIGDVVTAFLLVSQTNKTNGEYMVLGTNTPTKFVDMVKMVIDKVKEVAEKETTFEFVPWPKDSRSVDQGSMVIDYSKLNKLTGWYPKVKLEEGIERTVRFYKDRLNEYL